jgi:hypothetical protein
MDRRSSLAATLVVLATLSMWFVMVNQSRFTSGEFGIYLTEDSLKVVSDSDIRYYNASSHELTLTSECAERLKAMGWQLSGDFTMVVDGEVALSGVFVPPIVSRSYPSSQVVMLYPTFESINYRVMRMQMGYPWDQPSGPDPRENPRIIDYFEGSGKLIR